MFTLGNGTLKKQFWEKIQIFYIKVLFFNTIRCYFHLCSLDRHQVKCVPLPSTGFRFLLHFERLQYLILKRCSDLNKFELTRGKWSLPAYSPLDLIRDIFIWDEDTKYLLKIKYYLQSAFLFFQKNKLSVVFRLQIFVIKRYFLQPAVARLTKMDTSGQDI